MTLIVILTSDIGDNNGASVIVMLTLVIDATVVMSVYNFIAYKVTLTESLNLILWLLLNHIL